MSKTWILVANAHHARFFKSTASGNAIDEMADFVYPHTSAISDNPATDRSGDAGKGHGRTGHSGTQFEPHTSDEEKERHSFARQLADFINKGVEEQRCERLALLASSPMLGELRPHLSVAAAKVLHRNVAIDLTSFQGEDLKRRVMEAMLPTE